ncbi:MAG: peptidylprolyl isomerase [Bacteroidales bacterium]|nr:peptidylprolyl isomerase [Bacteroidales bacterium]MCB9012855.1 peptidylprolyl isomerase [Bacteroidales bacterium]
MFLLVLVVTASCQKKTEVIRITLQTELGDIKAELYTAKAPVTCRNFLNYIDSVGEKGGEFYRTVTLTNQPDNDVKIQVIQGGFNLADMDSSQIIPIPLERTNLTGILHKNGTLSMARDDPDSGSTEFFICIGDQPSLDFGGKRNPDGQGFAAFGRVTKGMDIVRSIQNSDSENQKLIPPVKIIRIYRD